MRIGIVTGEYPPMEGGVGAFTRELSLALKDLGHEIHIVTTAIGDAQGPVQERGLAVHRQIPRWGRMGIQKAGRLLEQITPDIVNLQYEIAAYGMSGWINLLPGALMRKAMAPLVVTFHDLLPPYLFPKAGMLRQQTVWRLARHADAIIATNAEDRRMLEPKVGSRGIPVRTIPIGSNISSDVAPDYDRASYRARYGWAHHDLVVGFFGFMNRSKGIEALLRAVALLRSRGDRVQLLFIGGRIGTSDATNASYADEIDGMIDDLGLAPVVHRTGFASQREVSAALKSVDVCALPYRDGANLRRGTLHAALAHGCAIITTTPRAIVPELAEGANIVLVPPDDPGALADAICTVGADTGLRAQLGSGAAELAARFTWPRIAAKTAAFFETLV